VLDQRGQLLLRSLRLRRAPSTLRSRCKDEHCGAEESFEADEQVFDRLDKDRSCDYSQRVSAAGGTQSMILRVGASVASLVLMLTLGVVAIAAERWAVDETINGKTRVWRESTTDGSPGAIKKTEGECLTMLQLAQWSHADDVARANRARTARGLEPIGPWAKYECRPYR
jgi:hypothetical protein